MNEPKRIQRKRTLGWRMPAGAVYVGRPTMWGNPFRIRRSLDKTKWKVTFEGEGISPEFTTKRDAQAEAVRLFEKWFDGSIAEIGTELHDFRNRYGWHGFQMANVAPYLLRSKDLCCWCGLDVPCHVDVILKVANVEVSDGT